MFDEFPDISGGAVYTVSQLNQEIKMLLETTIPVIWLEGEISNLKFHSSGHVYFSLKDRDSQIPAVMWRSRKERLAFTPQDGMKVLALGRVAVFHKRGYYQFDVMKLRPAGVGELQLAFEQLKNRLKAEGLFDQAQKKPIPRFPRRIGIVTSPTGAAIRDLYQVLNRRFSGVEVILFPVKVQGEGAAAEIAAAIDIFNEYGKVDVLIVGRGGGSLEDLWAFNEEEVARAIFRSKIPVISAVGHEIDFTISDFVADLRAPTPSAAAELAVPDREELLSRIHNLRQRMQQTSRQRLQFERDRLSRLTGSYSFRRAPDMLREHKLHLDELLNSLQRSVQHRISMLKTQVSSTGRRLRTLSPIHVLKRGYSICQKSDNGKVVRQFDELAAGEPVQLLFYRGSAQAVVEKISKTNALEKLQQRFAQNE
ncbi:MAG: exodeoxyribonuclease VII large subunit [Calditrichaeota bacterium]|nr:exodeoxyribonuclease VII large subunit [Calditrichota bacterium]